MCENSYWAIHGNISDYKLYVDLTRIYPSLSLLFFQCGARFQRSIDDCAVRAFPAQSAMIGLLRSLIVRAAAPIALYIVFENTSLSYVNLDYSLQ